MMKKKNETMRKTIIFLLCTMCMVSCTNWQEKYNAELSEVSEPIKAKYEFVKAKMKEAMRKRKCIRYEDAKKIPFSTLMRIIELSQEKTHGSSEWPDDVWFVYATDSVIHSDEFGTENILEAYRYSFERKIRDKSDYEYSLETFNEEVLPKFQNVKYLVVISDSVLVVPQMDYSDQSYEIGYYLDNVTIYDLENMVEVHNLTVVSKNSDRVYFREKDNGTLINPSGTLKKDLNYNRENTIIAKVNETLH